VNVRRHVLKVLLVLGTLPVAAQAQNNIVTVVGGGPNNVAALSASVGLPVGVAQDSSLNLYIADSHGNRVYKIDTTGSLTIFAGTGSAGYSGDTALAVAAQLSGPTGLFVDASNNLFIADSGNNVIREVDHSSLKITTVAGTGVAGFSGDTGAATSAQLSNPNGVFVDASNDIFIADSGNQVIREVVGTTINTIAGTHNVAGFSGNGGLATAAVFHNPLSVSLDSSGNIYVADHDNNEIREIVKATGNIQDFAGSPAGAFGATGDTGVATAALLHGPSAVFVDANNNVFIADTTNSEIREVTFVNGKIIRVAGNGLSGFTGDGGPATAAELSSPLGVFVDTTGNVVISDTANHFERQVVAASGNIHGIAGNGQLSFSGDGAVALNAALNLPAGIAVDGPRDIFIADTANNVIREVVASSGLIQTIAGTTGGALNGPTGIFVDTSNNVYFADTKNNVIREIVASTGAVQIIVGTGIAGSSGDGGPAAQAQLKLPTGVYVDSSGNIFIADMGNNLIREVVFATGKIQTVVGTNTPPNGGTPGFGGDGALATSALLSFPTGVFLDALGNIFVADTANNVIREVTISNHNINTVAGNHALGAGFGGDGALATSAQLNGPLAVIVDPSGNLFIADTANQVIREVTASDAKIKTVAGSHALGAGFSGDGGTATSAQLHSPSSIAIDTLGAVDIADTGNNRIRSVAGLVIVPVASLTPPTLTFNATVIARSSAAQIATLTNTGTAPMQVSGIGFTGTNANSFSETDNCPATLAGGANCTINVTFTPTVGGALTANLNVSDSAPTSPQTVALTGTGVSAVTLAPAGLSFPLQINTTTSSPQSITVTNNQTVTLNITSLTITGANSSSFSQVNTCGAALTSGNSCVITVTFTPNTTGSNSAIVSIADDAPGSPQTGTLFGLGTGATATMTPTKLTFATQAVATTSAAQVVTVTNGGKETLNINTIIFTGTNNGDFSQTTTCSSTVLPAGTCTISVTFLPTAGGSRTASLTLNDSAGDSPQSINLFGTGIDFEMVIPSGGSASQTVTAGSSALFAFQVNAVGGSATSDSITVKLVCPSTLPTGVGCQLPQSSVTVSPGTSANVSFTVTTTAKTALAPPNRWPNFGSPLGRRVLALYAIALLALLSLYRWIHNNADAFQGSPRRLASAVLLLMLMIGSVGFVSGCGSSEPPPSNGPPGPTLPGTYTISITGTAGNDTHALALKLVVQ
jgi:sugar lactone lactonase YvrE